MAQYTISISDSSSNLFLELMNSLKFVKKIEKIEYSIISEKHKEIVRSRIQKSDKDSDILLDWDNVKDEFIV